MPLLLYSQNLSKTDRENEYRCLLDFDVEIDRLSTESTKFNKYKDLDILPFGWPIWISSRLPRSSEALQNRVQHGVFGYTEASAALKNTLVARMKTFYNWDIQPDDLVFFPGVVAGLNLCCAGLLARRMKQPSLQPRFTILFLLRPRTKDAS